MTRYVALLRGINVSGKNKIAMAELKEGFAELGYRDAATCLNSGNVVFSGAEADTIRLTGRIAEMIKCRFGLDIPVFVILQEQLEKLLRSAPDWWGTDDKEQYDNLIFVLPPAAADQIREKIGEPTKELERIFIHENAIFWTFNRQKYAKANWWKKTASAGIAEKLTIRTANTIRKMCK